MRLQHVYTFEKTQNLTLKAEEVEKCGINFGLYSRNQGAFTIPPAAQTALQPALQVAMQPAPQAMKQPTMQTAWTLF